MNRKSVVALLTISGLFLGGQAFAASGVYAEFNASTGGDFIVDNTDPSESTVFIPKAGGGTSLVAGLDLRILSLLQINLGMGQRENVLINTDSDMIWKMEVGEAKLGINLGFIRFGVGRTKYQNPRLRGTYNFTDVSKDFHDSYASQYYIDFRVAENVYLGFRKTEADFTDLNTGNVYNGDSYGIAIFATFDEFKTR